MTQTTLAVVKTTIGDAHPVHHAYWEVPSDIFGRSTPHKLPEWLHNFVAGYTSKVLRIRVQHRFSIPSVFVDAGDYIVQDSSGAVIVYSPTQFDAIYTKVDGTEPLDSKYSVNQNQKEKVRRRGDAYQEGTRNLGIHEANIGEVRQPGYESDTAYRLSRIEQQLGRIEGRLKTIYRLLTEDSGSCHEAQEDSDSTKSAGGEGEMPILSSGSSDSSTSGD